MTGKHSSKEIEKAILELLSERDIGKTICPSDAARRLDATGWRDSMDAVRAAADRLKSRGQIEVLQKNRPIESASDAHGPIRLRLKANLKD